MLNATGTTLRSLGVIVFVIATSAAAHASEAFKLQTANADFYGVNELEAGQYERGTARFAMMLNLMGTAPSLRAPVLNNLCVSYIAQGRLEEGAAYCNEAVANGRDLGLALNNRGVMHARAGLYVAAVADFEAAIAARGTPDVARANLRLAKRRVAQVEPARDERVAGNEPRLDGDGA